MDDAGEAEDDDVLRVPRPRPDGPVSVSRRGVRVTVYPDGDFRILMMGPGGAGGAGRPAVARGRAHTPDHQE